MQIPQNIISMLSAKGKGYVEAAMKIAEGQRLVHEGTLEMAHLDGKKVSAKEHMHAGGVNVLAGVRDLAKPKVTPGMVRSLLREGDKSTRELAAALGRSIKRTRDLVAETDGVKNVGSGNKMRWSIDANAHTSRINKKISVANKTTRRPKTSKAAKGAFGAQTPRCKLILEAIQKDEWMTTSRLSKEVVGHHEFAASCCRLLEKAGMIWVVKKANNPSHAGLAATRSIEYWAADPKAKIEATNMHVPRMQVKDPTVLYPAIEEAIKAAEGWASKRYLENHTKLSGGPLNRVLKAMKKDGLIKTVVKKHNPAHKQPKNYERDATYWEMVGGA